MNRGANKKLIFHHEEHRKIFLDLLAEITVNYDASIHAYCLMGNHYHLLTQTPNGNLPQIMRHLDGVYTQRFNKTNDSDGPLFRGRYKAVLIEEGPYLLQVSRYIHLNPASIKSCINIDEYRWSSLGAYLYKCEAPPWLKKDIILDCLNSQNKVTGYADFIGHGNDQITEDFYNRKKLRSILGSENFKTKTTADLKEDQLPESAADLRTVKNRPSLTNILQKVANYYQVDISDLHFKKRGAKNLPRHMAITIGHKAYDYRPQEIVEIVGSIKTTTSSKLIKRFVDKMKQHPSLLKDYQNIIKIIDKKKRLKH